MNLVFGGIKKVVGGFVNGVGSSFCEEFFDIEIVV